MKTNIKCSTDSKRHSVEFHTDGRVTENGRDITCDAKRIATMIRLGGAHQEPHTCASFAALVQHGCEDILKRPPNSSGDQNLGNWREIYIRFEGNRVVVATMFQLRHYPADETPAGQWTRRDSQGPHDEL